MTISYGKIRGRKSQVLLRSGPVGVALSLLVYLVVLAAPEAEAAVSSAPPFTQCPPIGASPSCKVLLVIEPSGSISVYDDGAVGDYDGGDDTLVGVVNDSTGPVPAITVSGPGSDLAGFDGDGLCTFPPGCTWPAPTGYEGPANSFTTDPSQPDSAEVDFSGAGLAPGASTYFSLEGTLTSAVVTARQGTLQGLTVSPSDGLPGTIYTANWHCGSGPGAIGIAATDGQPLPDNSTDITVSLGGDRYSRQFQVDGDGAFQMTMTCAGVTNTAPFTVTAKPYVAIGDSYSSGEGASTYYPDTDIVDTDMCHRGIGSWSVPVAKKAHLTRDFVACSGAVIEDVYQYNVAFAKPVPPGVSKSLTPPNALPSGWPEIPQLDHVSRTGATKLVTLTMGGNNVGFPSIITDCIYAPRPGSKAGGFGCAKRDDGQLQQAKNWLRTGRPKGCFALPGIDPTTFTAEQICSNTAVPSLHGMYEDIARKVAAGGTVLVAGYPKLFGNTFELDPSSPTHKSCIVDPDAPFGDDPAIGSADVAWLNAQANDLNTTISQEVAIAQSDLASRGSSVTVKFADVDNGSKSMFATHRICDTGTPYFHALELSGVLKGSQPWQWSFHPNDDGINAYGNAITGRL